MAVEFIAAAHVRAAIAQVQQARLQAVARCGPVPEAPDTSYWESVFEANAAEVLSVLPAVTLAEGFTVRYRCFGERGNDILVRPFVARATTDVERVRQLIEWHAPPDAHVTEQRAARTHDVELLYRHFAFQPSATGIFEYWLAMQELWASARWTHSHVIASAAELSQITAGEGWSVVQPVESYEPAVVRSTDGARLAVLVECPLQRFEITLQQIDIGADQSVTYADPILVASGPRGYML